MAVFVGDLASTNRKQVLSSGNRAIYVNPAHLLFVRGSTLMAQRFDAGKLETTGDAVPVAEQVHSFSEGAMMLGHFSASQNGVLAYVAGNPAGNAQLTWFDRKGNKLGTVGAPGFLQYPSLSPGTNLASHSRGLTPPLRTPTCGSGMRRTDRNRGSLPQGITALPFGRMTANTSFLRHGCLFH